MPESGFKDPKRVLLTGAAGFIGSALSRRLAALGSVEVIPLKADLTQWLLLKEELKNLKVDAVVHLAAQSHVPTAEQRPDETFRINVLGTAYLAELLAQSRQEIRFVFASTAHVYDMTQIQAHGFLTEDGSIHPLNTYATSKHMAENFLKGWVNSRSGLSCEVLRFFNHTHKSQSPDFFFPRMYQEMLAAAQRGDKEVKIAVGNIDIERDLGSLSDLLDALTQVVLSSGSTQTGFEIFNLGSGTGKNLRSLTLLLAKRLGLEVTLVTDPSRVRTEPARIVANIDKAKMRFSWTPKAVTDDLLVDAFLQDVVS